MIDLEIKIFNFENIDNTINIKSSIKLPIFVKYSEDEFDEGTHLKYYALTRSKTKSNLVFKKLDTLVSEELGVKKYSIYFSVHIEPFKMNRDDEEAFEMSKISDFFTLYLEHSECFRTIKEEEFTAEFNKFLIDAND